MNPDFGHAPATVAFWRRWVGAALKRGATTPFYLFSADPIQTALEQLEAHDFGLPVVHWLSCKTQPLPPLLKWWRAQGRPVEVVSEFEFLAALKAGYAPEQILINGPAKQRWLPAHARPGLRVNFDSRAELAALLPLARQLEWSTGIRVLTGEEFDPENKPLPTQFGFTFDEALVALARLRRARVRLETVHFHLRTNVVSHLPYERAIAEVAALCHRAGFAPRHLDCGGGLPPRNIRSRGQRPLDAEFSLSALAGMYRRAVKQFPGLRELWLENGRHVSAASGVLVLRVLDVKERRGLRQLICDGGRTLNALVSLWEEHALIPLRRRSGPQVLTAVHGPTCMAFDQIARRPLPATLRSGDHLLWLDAGAYHLGWETHFSHGLAEVLWHEGGHLETVRAAETFADWAARWRWSSGLSPKQLRSKLPV